MQLIDKVMPHINKITEDIIEIGYNLGCLVWYGLGLDEFVEVINDE